MVPTPIRQIATPNNLTKLAYQTLQQGKSLAGLAHKELSTKLMEVMAPGAIPKTKPITKELLIELRRSMAELEKRDWLEAEEGIYPKSLLFDAPWLDWAKTYPLVWLDLPSTWKRRKARKVREIPIQIEAEMYPNYYLQNFHHQTDGYLSDHSAELYDIQVEILFNGTADSMRRRVLAPLKRGLNRFSKRSQGSLRVLDVATGTGRTLNQIRGALPKIEILGIDLSLSYLRQASKYLNQNNSGLAQLIRGNAEDLPFSSHSMQGVTCVFLLHELPREARYNVLKECWRVLEPGGVLVIADSIQPADSPQFSLVMENFQRVFHEPYYKDYINDNIEDHLNEIGFNGVTAESHFMTRVWNATKPTK
ncbi:class I SAM-dependent methyltransferase [Prochlorococcus sp. MIT 1300]|uniref:class I SAM-dependent methyltransferase n=1 Tax=Prochlorococcus sp. MIT 1300 TaxID=3096218 RepID=UPI002A748B2B|nr:class I SAM-dependent methyltransferase [Prochlorococcus sp. MIT 1300]